MKKIKVVHICSSLEGGAGLCATRIMQSTSLLGIENYALIKNGTKTENVDIVERKEAGRGLFYIQKFLHHFHLWPKAVRVNYKIIKAFQNHDISGVFTSPLTEYKISDHHWISEADIIHIHWVGGFLDYDSFFKNVKKPIVWTMHDENAGLGGYHYMLWKNSATPKGMQLEDSMVHIKKEAYRHIKSMQIVAISSMMKDFIIHNSLLHDFPCTMIHNGIDEKLFTLIDRKIAREALNIQENRLVFIFVAYNIDDERKGLKILTTVLDSLGLSNITLLCIGNYHNCPQVSFDIRCEGLITHPRILSLYYSAANFFIMPSFQEAFAQTPMEAMACGTPVIAFPCSGTADIIKPFNGLICKDFTKEALVDAIKKAMNVRYDRNEIRNYIIEHFSYDIIAKQYVQLYERTILEMTKSK